MEDQARIAAFKWLETQVQLHGDVLPRKLLEAGFIHNGQRIALLGPQGIFKPKTFELPISITTVHSGPYEDSFDSVGFLKYKYRGTDPNHRDNVGLSKAMIRRIPLIYFHGIAKSKYLAVWPVYIVGNHPTALEFTVAVDAPLYLNESTASDFAGASIALSQDIEYIQRGYSTSTIKQRLHQRTFRDRVIEAYEKQCAICRFKHIELLDAAHIIPDSEEKGDPIVSNGLSLCKIHHAAYDSHLMGIRPDYRIVIRPDVLSETDGIMLKYGFQELHGSQIILPKNLRDRPDPERLRLRYHLFEEIT